MKCKIVTTFIDRRKNGAAAPNFRTAVFLLTVFVTSVFTQPSLSQPLLPAIKLQNVTLRQMITAIENNTDFVFLISDDAAGELNAIVTVETEGKEVSEVLAQGLKNTRLGYSIAGKQVTIYRKAAVQNPPPHRTTGR